jgi:glycosyltransferase involved in cell wall biosynthesis
LEGKRLKIQFVSPVLNEETLLPRLIKSLLDQSNKDWNLLIVDNGSSDSTFSIAKEWENQDPRIKTFSLKEKKDKVSESWKEALAICFEITDCDYVQITPGDDYLLNDDYVEFALQLLSENSVNGLVPACRYENRNVVLDKIQYHSLFKDWNYVHLIFGIYKTGDLYEATLKLGKLDGIDITFDWWLAYFLIEYNPSYSPKSVFYRESSRPRKVEINPVVRKPIFDKPILRPFKRIYSLRHPIRNYMKATSTDFKHYVLVSGSIGIQNRFRLIMAFILKIVKVY